MQDGVETIAGKGVAADSSLVEQWAWCLRRHGSSANLMDGLGLYWL